MKQHKPCFDEVYLGVLDQKKQAKSHWVQGPNKSNVVNLNTLRREASRPFRNRRNYLKAKIDEIETNSKIKNIRDL